MRSMFRPASFVRLAKNGNLSRLRNKQAAVSSFERLYTMTPSTPAQSVVMSRALSVVASRTSRKKTRKKLENKNGVESTPKLYSFVHEAEQLLEDVHRALLPFQAPVNEGFVMSAKYKGDNKKHLEEVELVCGKEGGAFHFRIDAKNEVINAATPVSGALQYYFDGDKWLNVHDHHDIRGIIVRDMLRLTSSAPKL